MKKNVWRVTELLMCDYYKPTPGALEAMEYGKYAHDIVESNILKECRDCVSEVQIQLPVRVGNEEYLITGHPDILDYENLIIWEVKPNRLKIPDIWVHQVLFYESMLSRDGLNWRSGFILYDYNNPERIVRRVLLRYGSRDHDKLMTQLLLLRRKHGRIKIASSYCSYCMLRKDCDKPIWLPSMKSKHMTVIIKKYLNKRRANPRTTQRAIVKNKNPDNEQDKQKGLERWM